MTNQVLLLNADFRPISTISLGKLVSLLSKGRIEIVETVPGKMLRSTFDAQPFPSVVRLNHYVNVPQRHAVWSRRAVFSRDGYVCQYCGTKLNRENATVDHIIPVEQCKILGVRASTWGNTVCACSRCNSRKANRSMRDAGMKFFNPDFIARTPRVSYLVVSGDVPDSWRVYLKT